MLGPSDTNLPVHIVLLGAASWVLRIFGCIQSPPRPCSQILKRETPEPPPASASQAAHLQLFTAPEVKTRLGGHAPAVPTLRAPGVHSHPPARGKEKKASSCAGSVTSPRPAHLPARTACLEFLAAGGRGAPTSARPTRPIV